MENNENRQNEELQFSNQDHTLDSDNTTVRKTRIKHKRGPRKKKEKKEKPRSHGRNQFNQFPQRDYSQKEVSSLEKQLLQGNRS